MKPFSLVVLAGMACIAQSPLFAQNPDSEYQQAADARITNLDKAQIPTGILDDRVFPTATLTEFKATDSSSAGLTPAVRCCGWNCPDSGPDPQRGAGDSGADSGGR